MKSISHMQHISQMTPDLNLFPLIKMILVLPVLQYDDSSDCKSYTKVDFPDQYGMYIY